MMSGGAAFTNSAAQAQHLLALRRAAMVASASLDQASREARIGVEDFVSLSKQRIELESHILDTQTHFVEIFAKEMTPNQRMQLLFDVIDEDGSGIVNLDEFSQALRKMEYQHLKVMREILPLVERNAAFFEESGLKGFNYEAFAALLREHCADSKSTLSDFLNVLVSQICFYEKKGEELLYEAVTILLGSPPEVDVYANGLSFAAWANLSPKVQQRRADIARAREEARMLLVFDVMDHYRKGRVPLRDVVKHTIRYAEYWEMNTAQQQVLFMMQKHDDVVLEYPGFSEFLRNIDVTLGPTVSVIDLCNAITLSICRQDVTDEDMKHFFVDVAENRVLFSGASTKSTCSNGTSDSISTGNSIDNSNNSKISASTSTSASTIQSDNNIDGIIPAETEKDKTSDSASDNGDELMVEFPWVEAAHRASINTTPTDFGKLSRLFDLWDVDHNGTLDLSEIALGIRKFQQNSPKPMSAAVKASIDALVYCDKDHDNRLDREEFAALIMRLAQICSTDVRRLVDYMVVNAALEDNNATDVAFIQTLLPQSKKMMEESMKRLRRDRSKLGKLWKGFHLGGKKQ